MKLPAMLAVFGFLFLLGCISAEAARQQKDPNTIETYSLQELIALGEGLECDVEMTYGGEKVSSELLVKGDRYRYTLPVYQAGAPLVQVYKNRTLYVRLPTGFAGGCAWATAHEKEGIWDTNPPASIPGAKFSCIKKEIPESAFDTSGKACNPEDIPIKA